LWTLSCPEREIDITIGLGDLDLVHFHTPHLIIGQNKQNSTQQIVSPFLIVFFY